MAKILPFLLCLFFSLPLQGRNLGRFQKIPLQGKKLLLAPSLEEVWLVPKKGRETKLFHALLSKEGSVQKEKFWKVHFPPFFDEKSLHQFLEKLFQNAFVQRVYLPFYTLKGRRYLLSNYFTVHFFTQRAQKTLEAQYSLLASKAHSPSLWKTYIARTPIEAVELTRQLLQNPKVKTAFVLSFLPLALKYVPNDPLYPQQWHLKNTTYPGEDVASGNVEALWDKVKGSGQVIALLDNGLAIAHPDLQAQVLPSLCYDYEEGDTDPTSSLPHGTLVAGLIASSGGNGQGVIGLSFQANLIAYRLLGTNAQTEENFADAMVRHLRVISVHNNSWGLVDGKGLYGGPSPLFRAALSQGIREGRQGKGIIYIWAAGNGGNKDNSNLDGFANSRYVIAVGAIDEQGKQTSYSEAGTNILIVAPGGSASSGMVSTDLPGTQGINPGDYTTTSDGVKGTSFAAPLVSASAALLLEANPNLTWRDVREIFIRSARQNDPANPKWQQNGAGFFVHPAYGFGALNAYKAYQLAKTWPLLPREEATTPLRRTVGLAIPDGTSQGVEVTLPVFEQLVIEAVEVYVHLRHPQWTSLHITLYSPKGSKSELLTPFAVTPPSSTLEWTFLTWHHYGEFSQGTWRLVIQDLTAGDQGELVEWGIQIYGRSPSAHIAWENQLIKKFALSHTLQNSPGCNMAQTEESFFSLFLLFLLLLGKLFWTRRCLWSSGT